MTQSISYADAGVSIDNANRAVAKIREYARSTFNERTLTEIGSFGGMFALVLSIRAVISRLFEWINYS